MSSELVPAEQEVAEPHAQERILKALADWVNGASIRKASRDNNVPYSTLKGHIDRDSTLNVAREQRLEQAFDLAIAWNMEATKQAFEKLMEGETSDPRIDAGISKDAIGRLASIVKPENKGPGDILEQLLGNGGAIEISVKPNQPAIDVTPERGEE